MEIERAPFGEEFEGRTAELISRGRSRYTFSSRYYGFWSRFGPCPSTDRNGEIADISFGNNSPEDYSKIGGISEEW